MSAVVRLMGMAFAMLAAPGAAQDTLPDFSGFWGPIFDIGDPDPRMLAKLPDGTVLVQDTGVVEFPRGEFGGLEPTREALARAEEWQPEDDMTLQRVCMPPSIVYALQGPFPFEIHQTEALIVLRYEYFDQTRLVFMDGRTAPADYPHSKMGFSTGHWEGEELVIETTHIAPSTITNNGLDHSADIRMVERYRIDGESGRLEVTQWFSDPAMIANDGVRWIEWEKRDGQHVYPYECDPSFALEYSASQPE